VDIGKGKFRRGRKGHRSELLERDFGRVSSIGEDDARVCNCFIRPFQALRKLA
jgi:hypothetical protein